MSEFSPWMDHANHKEAAKLREMSLPPHLRLTGNTRYLRDALLSVMLLSDDFSPPGETWIVSLERMRLRGNTRADMRCKAAELKAHLKPEQIEKASKAAGELFHWELTKARRVQSGLTKKRRK